MKPVVLDVASVANQVFNLPGTTNHVSLEESGNPAYPLQLRSTDAVPTFETTDFTDPTSSLTIAAGTANDTITIPGPDLHDLTSSFTIGSSGSPFAVTTIGGTLNLSNPGTLLALNAGTINLNANVITTGTQDYNGAVKVGALALSLTATGVTFDNTVDDAMAPGTDALTVNGSATFGSIVGTTPLHALHVTGATAVNTTAVSTTATQAYDGALSLGGNATLTGVGLNFGGTIDDVSNTATHTLTLAGGAGSVSIASAIGGTHPLLGFTISSASSAALPGIATGSGGINVTATGITLNGSLDTTRLAPNAGSINLTGAVVLGNDISILTHAAGITSDGGITFTGTTDATANGGQSLGLVAVPAASNSLHKSASRIRSIS